MFSIETIRQYAKQWYTCNTLSQIQEFMPDSFVIERVGSERKNKAESSEGHDTKSGPSLSPQSEEITWGVVLCNLPADRRPQNKVQDWLMPYWTLGQGCERDSLLGLITRFSTEEHNVLYGKTGLIYCLGHLSSLWVVSLYGWFMLWYCVDKGW